MVEAVGVEPTSEELQPAASPCAARRLISSRRWPANGRIMGPALSFRLCRSGGTTQLIPSNVVVTPVEAGTPPDR